MIAWFRRALRRLLRRRYRRQIRLIARARAMSPVDGARMGGFDMPRGFDR